MLLRVISPEAFSATEASLPDAELVSMMPISLIFPPTSISTNPLLPPLKLVLIALILVIFPLMMSISTTPLNSLPINGPVLIASILLIFPRAISISTMPPIPSSAYELIVPVLRLRPALSVTLPPFPVLKAADRTIAVVISSLAVIVMGPAIPLGVAEG